MKKLLAVFFLSALAGTAAYAEHEGEKHNDAANATHEHMDKSEMTEPAAPAKGDMKSKTSADTPIEMDKDHKADH